MLNELRALSDDPCIMSGTLALSDDPCIMSGTLALSHDPCIMSGTLALSHDSLQLPLLKHGSLNFITDRIHSDRAVLAKAVK